jgi:hypothetical protein
MGALEGWEDGIRQCSRLVPVSRIAAIGYELPQLIGRSTLTRVRDQRPIVSVKRSVRTVFPQHFVVKERRVTLVGLVPRRTTGVVRPGDRQVDRVGAILWALVSNATNMLCTRGGREPA